MGSIVPLRRRRAVQRSWLKAPADAETRQSATSLLIFVGAFGTTAIVMSVAVVAALSNTWTDVLVMSAFVFVVALAKIGLADALFYVMIRSDSAAEAAMAEKAKAGAVFRRPLRTPPRPRQKQPAGRKYARKTGSVTLAPLPNRPRPSLR